MMIKYDERYGVSQASVKAVELAEKRIAHIFERIDEIELTNQAKILVAFADERISSRHFTPTTGYGYDDIGRDALDHVFAHAFECEDALVRPQFSSGTHTLYTALRGMLEPGDTLLAVTGKPYDTLEKAIGISGDEYCSLKRNKIKYEQISLTGAGEIDLDALKLRLKSGTVKVAHFQRSRGYDWRNAISPEKMKPAFELIKKYSANCTIFVDNCYGEFTQAHEPIYYGADIIAGSLIKNPGGGLAPTGGYIAGNAKKLKMIESLLTVPGIGRESGSYAGSYRPFYQGLFMAPHTVAQSLKTAVLFAAVFEDIGLNSMPSSDFDRADIVQALRFDTPDKVIEFCKGIQAISPIDSFVDLEPWDMPGYSDPVIMAAGAFVQGSSIELSADAPIRPPYTVYIQGGLTYSHGKLAVMKSLDRIMSSGEKLIAKG